MNEALLGSQCPKCLEKQVNCKCEMKYRDIFRKQFFRKAADEDKYLVYDVFIKREKDLYIEWLESKLTVEQLHSESAAREAT